MWTRRDYLKAMLAVGTTTGLGLPLGRAGEQDPDVILRITAKPDVVPIWKGGPTAVFRFAGEVMKGRQDALRPSGSYLGPTLELRRGERVRIHFETLPKTADTTDSFITGATQQNTADQNTERSHDSTLGKNAA